MRKYLSKMLKDGETRVRQALSEQILPDTKAYAVCDPKYRETFTDGFFDGCGCVGASHAVSRLAVMLACYLEPESAYYRSAEIAERADAALTFLQGMQRDDGLLDDPDSGFDSAYATALSVMRALDVLRLFRARPCGSPGDALERRLADLVRCAADGISEGGFRAPDECLTIAAALADCADYFDEPSLCGRARAYLAFAPVGGVGGVYATAEAAAKGSSDIDALLTLDRYLPDAACGELAVRRLHTLLADVEPDGAVFTADAAQTVYADAWCMACLEAGVQCGASEFFGAAEFIRNAAEQCGRKAPDCLARFLNLPEADAPLPADSAWKPHSGVYAGSGVTRVFGRGFTVRMCARERAFLHITTQEMHVCMCLTGRFGAQHPFKPEKLEQANGAFYMEETVATQYVLPPDGGAGETENSPCGERSGSKCVLTARIAVLPDGVDVRLSAQGTAYVPVCVEITGRGMQRVAGERFSDDASKGGARLVSSGGLQFIGAHDVLDIGAAFACHGDIPVRSGGETAMPGAYTLYLTDYTPLDRTIGFRLTRR